MRRRGIITILSSCPPKIAWEEEGNEKEEEERYYTHSQFKSDQNGVGGRGGEEVVYPPSVHFRPPWRVRGSSPLSACYLSTSDHTSPTSLRHGTPR